MLATIVLLMGLVGQDPARGDEGPTLPRFPPPPELAVLPSLLGRHEELAPSSAEVVLELLDTVWNEPEARGRRRAGAVVRKAAGKNASLAEAQYAYALVLFRHGSNKDAEGAMQRVAKLRPDSALPHIVLGWRRANEGRLAEAMDAFRSARQAQPELPIALDAFAMVATFAQETRPEGLSIADVAKRETALFSQLDSASQARYREVRDWTLAYVGQLPALKAQRLAQLEPMRAAKKDAERQLLDATEKLRSAQLEADRLQQLLVAINLNGATVRQRYDSLIAAALAAGQTELAAQYRFARDVELTRLAQERGLIAGQFEAAQRAVLELTQVSIERRQQVDAFEQKLAEEEAAIEALTLSVPVPFDLERERERLVAEARQARRDRSGSASVADREPSELSDSEMERKANGLLSLADSMRQNGMENKALSNYRKVLVLYPETESAVRARAAIEELEAQSE